MSYPSKNSVASLKSALNLFRDFQNTLYIFIKCKVSRTENMSIILNKITGAVLYGCITNNRNISNNTHLFSLSFCEVVIWTWIRLRYSQLGLSIHLKSSGDGWVSDRPTHILYLLPGAMGVTGLHFAHLPMATLALTTL